MLRPKVLAEELETFECNKLGLLKDGNEGKFVLIKGSNVIGVFESDLDAIYRGYEKLGNVPFLVKEVTQIEQIIDLARVVGDPRRDSYIPNITE